VILPNVFSCEILQYCEFFKEKIPNFFGKNKNSEIWIEIQLKNVTRFFINGSLKIYGYLIPFIIS
jgi:hypothetical protein